MMAVRCDTCWCTPRLLGGLLPALKPKLTAHMLLHSELPVGPVHAASQYRVLKTLISPLYPAVRITWPLSPCTDMHSLIAGCKHGPLACKIVAAVLHAAKPS